MINLKMNGGDCEGDGEECFEGVCERRVNEEGE